MISAFQKYSFVTAGFCNATESASLEQPILMDQVHGVDTLIITNSPSSVPQCDALVSSTEGLKLTIKTADCAPVLFLDPMAKVIAATHAGWKGAFQGILENTVLTMLKLGATLPNIHTAIGPHLTKENFQVSVEMKNLFPTTEHRFFISSAAGIYFDFTAYLVHRLERAGIHRIDLFPIDTFADSTYNSYRRDKTNPARQYSFIQLNKGV